MANRPRLVYVVAHPVTAKSFLRGQLEAMADRGFDVTVVASPGPELDAIASPRVSTVPLRIDRPVGGLRDVIALARLVRVFRRIRPTLVNASTPKASLLGLLAARLVRVPVRIYTLRGLRLQTTRGLPRLALTGAERLACSCAHRVICVSASLRDAYAPHVGRQAHKLVVLGSGSSNGVDLERVKRSEALAAQAASFGASMGLRPTDRVVGFVGRLTRDKGIADLYRAFLEVAGDSHDVRLLLVGDFEPHDRLAPSLAAALAADPRVVITGFVADARPCYLRMRVLVLPSYREGLPNAALEAGALGIPVAGYAATGTCDAVVDGRSGTLVPVGDERALAAALARYLEQPSLAQAHGDAGRRYVEKHFADRDVWANLAKEYDVRLRAARAFGSHPDPRRARSSLPPTREGERGAAPARVLHVITDLDVGGAEITLCRLLEHVDPSGFDPCVVSLLPPGPLATRLERGKIPVATLGMRRGRADVLALLELARIIRRVRPAVVQTWMYHADLLGGLAARLAGVHAIVWGIHHTSLDAARRPRQARAVAVACARLSPGVPRHIVCSSQAARDLHRGLGYAAEKLVVIENGYDLEEFHPDVQARLDVRRELALTEDTPLVGLVARFDPQKDHRTFVTAAARIAAAVPRVHFVLCGRGVTGENRALRAWIEGTQIASRFHLLGARPDVARIAAALDVGALSSLSESFPNVVAEMMAAGVPCVATGVGDVARIVGDTGAVVPPSDPVALAREAVRLLEMSGDERTALGRRARSRIREHFGVERMVRAYEDLWNDAIASRRPARRTGPSR